MSDTCESINSEPVREIVTKERLYERLNNSITRSQMSIMKESARLDLLKDTKRNLDEYFEDSEKGTNVQEIIDAINQQWEEKLVMIRNEIADLVYNYAEEDYEYGHNDALMKATQIIDKYKEGEE